MNPRAKLAFFNDDDDDDLTIQSKPLDDAKARTFTQGVLKKTKKEKEKEAEAAKREEEERDAAKAYAEFLDVFEGPETPQLSVASGKTRSLGFVKASDGSGKTETYQPLAKPNDDTPIAPRASRAREPSPPIPAASKPKGKRAMDAFLEELKRDQASREARLKSKAEATGSSVTALHAFEGQYGSRDRGDPLTTNVFVTNLPMGISEHSLGMFFARNGPVGSVKIMWPRSDDGPALGPGLDITARRGKGGGMSGFVSFMTRKAAEACVRDMDGFNWGGCVLRVGWSKAVPIAARPAYDPEGPGLDPDPDLVIVVTDLQSEPNMGVMIDHVLLVGPDPVREIDKDDGNIHAHVRGLGLGPGLTPRAAEVDLYRMVTDAHRALDGIADILNVDESTADRVNDRGEKYGDVLRHRERHNTKYSFMIDRSLPAYHLYRSLTERRYRCPYADIPFDDEGDNSAYSTGSAEESEKEKIRKGTLGRLGQRRFDTMLRSLTGRKGEIARCMAFSLEHSDAVTEVVDTIISSLLVESTPVPKKISRLFLMCDILHNSAATIPNAWKFRGAFQERLPMVFDHLSEIYHSFPGRITAETFKKQVLSVVEVWEDWIVFPADFTTLLRVRLDGTKANENQEEGSLSTNSKGENGDSEMVEGETQAPSKFKASTFKPAEEPSVVDEEAVDDMELDSNDEEEDIEGEAIALDGDELAV